MALFAELLCLSHIVVLSFSLIICHFGIVLRTLGENSTANTFIEPKTISMIESEQQKN